MCGSVLDLRSPQRPFRMGRAGASLPCPGASRVATGHCFKGMRSHKHPGPGTDSRGRVFPAHPAAPFSAAHPPWRPRGSSLPPPPTPSPWPPCLSLSTVCPPSRLLSADHHPSALLTAWASPTGRRRRRSSASSTREDSNGHSVSLRQVPWLKQGRSPLPPHARSQPGLCNMYKVRGVHPRPSAGHAARRSPAAVPVSGQRPGRALSRGHSRPSTALVSRVWQREWSSSQGKPAEGTCRDETSSRGRAGRRPSPREGPVGAPGSAGHGQGRAGRREWPAATAPARRFATSVGTGA